MAPDRNGGDPNGYGRSQSPGQRMQYRAPRRFQDEMNGYPNMPQEWQDFDAQSPVFTRALAGATPRHPEEDKELENTDTSRDPSTDNGDSSGNNSLEAQQWSDTVRTER
ncbi:unnamed protein product [Phytophthora lilii]|uniref:Unnamed protein product n=1 Tax=Phytophthora lilii TaxID=2077276 RepID=A0A9W7D8V3_9STRA|nr:unnamed protein product [Phytophthora lilii]